MRLLFLTNYYPPFERGGYEQNCRDIADALAARGHDVAVVTSASGAKAVDERKVYRVLNLELDERPFRATVRSVSGACRPARQSVARFADVISRVSPDLLFVWGMWNLSKRLLEFAERQVGLRVAYYISDYWPMLPDPYVLHWQAPARNRLSAFPKQILARFMVRHLTRNPDDYRPRFANAVCVSNAVRSSLLKAGLPLHRAAVIHNGINPAPFVSSARPSKPRRNGDPFALIYAGRLSPDKGVETAIDGIHDALRRGVQATLTLVGRGSREYEARLHRKVRSLDLESRVAWNGWVEPTHLPELLARHDAFVYPSEWAEPLSLAVQQAMAARLPAIVTPVGGMPELVTHEHNGLFFSPGSPNQLADRISDLANDVVLADRIADAGQQTILSEFNIERMASELENYLQCTPRN